MSEIKLTPLVPRLSRPTKEMADKDFEIGDAARDLWMIHQSNCSYEELISDMRKVIDLLLCKLFEMENIYER